MLNPGTRDDLTILRALRDYFIQTDEGIRLLNLYYAHSAETGAMGLSSPTLTLNALETIRNYLPGFLGLVNGEGDKYIIKQSMIDQVNEVWDVLAADGSTSLSTTINTERAKYNNLQDFVGMNFNEWAEALGVREKPTAVESFRSYK